MKRNETNEAVCEKRAGETWTDTEAFDSLTRLKRQRHRRLCRSERQKSNTCEIFSRQKYTLAVRHRKSLNPAVETNKYNNRCFR